MRKRRPARPAAAPAASAKPTASPADQAPTAAIRPVSVSIAEAARIVGCSKITLYRLATRGHLVLRKLGSSTVIKYDDLEQLIDNLPRAAVRVHRSTVGDAPCAGRRT